MITAFSVSAQLSSKVGDWPQWRGLNRDGVSLERGLLKQWPEVGPALAWKVTHAGGGFAGLALVQDRIYLMGDMEDGCYLMALNRANGQVSWKSRIGEAGGHDRYPGPRGTPTVDGDALYALSQGGDLVCLDSASGKLRWQKSLRNDLGGKKPGWAFAESLLVDGNKVLCTPGGAKGTIAALDKKSGAVLWQSAEFTDGAQYGSVIKANIGGIPQYLQMTMQSVAGVDANSGALLWRALRPGKTAVVPTLLSADDLVYSTSGYGVGCYTYSVKKVGNRFEASETYTNRVIANHHGGVIKLGDYVYGHSDTGGWTCQEFKTGKIAWQNRGVGKGSVAYADGHFYCRSEDGPIALIEANPMEYKEKSRFNQPDRSTKKSWPHPVIAAGKLYIRDQELLLCYDIQAK